MKKAQSQIITTVLIILLVLAAIVIVWQVVNSTVRSGAEQVESQGACIGRSLEITNISTNSVTVKNTGTSSVDGINVYVGGELVNTTEQSLASGATTSIVATVANTQLVEAAVIVDGSVCPSLASETAAGLS